MTRTRLLLCLLAVVWSAHIRAAIVATPHVQAELVSQKLALAPGETATVALRMTMKDGWHTYWKHPGDSGEPTAIDWTLPAGFRTGEIAWPYPHNISLPPLTTYGYEGEVMLLVPVTAPADARPGTTATLDANVFWMVCEKVCIPEEVKLQLALPIAASPSRNNPRHAASFNRFRAMVPVVERSWRMSASRTSEGFALSVQTPSRRSFAPSSLRFFASDGPLIEHAAPQQPVVQGDHVTIAIKRSPYLTGVPKRIRGVLVGAQPLTDGGARAIEVDAPIDASAPAVIADARPSTPRMTLWVALVLAFLGGVILNLMPCVFPVVSLKVLNFIDSAGHDARRVRLHGLSFAGGVLVAFWILAALLLALRGAGTEIGWGFQLQSPPFVAAMTFLIFGLGLALAGVVEIGTSLTRLGNAERRSGGYAGSVMNGALATVVATPCTAPFMGAALGFAMTQSALSSLLIFTALGAGMAVPYVALSMWPPLLRFLPRPGAWMDRFKQAMAFPLFATAAWLVWVFGIQTGVDGVLRLLIGLTLLALGAWIAGQWATVAARTRTRWVARVVAITVVASGLGLAMRAAPVTAAPATQSSGIAWETFTPARVAELRASNRPVFIDFTAAWCLSCKVNERVTFSSAEVQKLVRERGIVMLKADWTSRSPEITRALAEFGRSGVPLYVLYSSDQAVAPRLLPEVLTPGILIAALEEVR